MLVGFKFDAFKICKMIESMNDHMKRLIFLCLMVFFSVETFAQQESVTEAYIVKLHQKKFDWMIQKKYDSLSNVLDERLVYIHSNGWAETKQEVLADIKSGKLNYTNVKLTESSARIFQKAAIVNGKGTFSVVMDGKPLDIQLYYTEVYVKKKSGWKLVSRHANKI